MQRASTMARALRACGGALVLALASNVGAATLFDQSDLVNAPKAGRGGTDLSLMQAEIGARVVGFAASATSATRIADDFTVPAAGWQVSGISVFAFQPGATPKQPSIDGLNFRIWDGVPGAPGSSVVFGDATTNRFGNARFADMYRVAGKVGDLSKPVFVVSSKAFDLALKPGTYWLDVQLDGARPAGPYVPPAMIPADGANAFHQRGETWSRIDDGGYSGALPIRITGTVGAR